MLNTELNAIVLEFNMEITVVEFSVTSLVGSSITVQLLNSEGDNITARTVWALLKVPRFLRVKKTDIDIM